MAFERKFDNIQTLLDSGNKAGYVFINYVRPAVMKGKLFMGIRVNRLDFYAGGNVFLQYEYPSFKANRKIYAEHENTEEITNNPVLAERAMGADWKNRFDELIQKCEKYNSDKSRQEERKVIQSCFPRYEEDAHIIVLDREININTGSSIKCDWLLYNTEKQQLKFAEVKMDYHKDLVKNKNGIVPVIGQISRYSSQYSEHKDIIIKQYQEYIQILNKLLGIQLPAPKSFLDTSAGLLIFQTKENEFKLKDELKAVNPFVGKADCTSHKTLEDIWKHFDP